MASSYPAYVLSRIAVETTPATARSATSYPTDISEAEAVAQEGHVDWSTVDSPAGMLIGSDSFHIETDSDSYSETTGNPPDDTYADDGTLQGNQAPLLDGADDNSAGTQGVDPFLLFALVVDDGIAQDAVVPVGAAVATALLPTNRPDGRRENFPENFPWEFSLAGNISRTLENFHLQGIFSGR